MTNLPVPELILIINRGRHILIQLYIDVNAAVYKCIKTSSDVELSGYACAVDPISLQNLNSASKDFTVNLTKHVNIIITLRVISLLFHLF